MTITLRGQSTVMFTGDSITDGHRAVTENGLGCGYPLLAAGQWGLRHPRRAIRWINSAGRGDKVMDLEARWQSDVLDLHPDVVSILVGANDMGWHTLDPNGHVISTQDFADGYRRLLIPLVAKGVRLILIEPFLLPISGVVDTSRARVDDEVRAHWRTDLDPKIRVVRNLAARFGAELIAADSMFAELTATTGAEHWSTDGVHPTPAGHAALAREWLRVVA